MAPPQRMLPQPPPVPFPVGGPGGPMDEPPAKRQKTEDNLIPENHFLSMHRVSFYKKKILSSDNGSDLSVVQSSQICIVDFIIVLGLFLKIRQST